MLSRLLDTCAALVFPVECESCETPLAGADGPGLCVACASQIRWIHPPFCAGCGRTSERERCVRCQSESFHFDAVFAAAVYDGPLKRLLQSYKFAGQKTLGRFLADALVGFADRHLDGENFDAVVSVPLDGAKLRSRGFNQSLLLSRRTARALDLPDLSKKMRRLPSPTAQSLLGKSGRKANVEGRFFVRDAEAVRGKRILLVDDILTTGHTASECARVLKAAGAAGVTALVFARGA